MLKRLWQWIFGKSARFEMAPVCFGCGNEIDPDVCWCGDEVKNHGYHDNHSAIPMGCDCGRAKK